MIDEIDKGIFPVLAIPFDNQGKILYEDIKKLLEFQLEAGANGIALFGFASEFYKLSLPEKIKILRLAKKAINGKIPVIATINEQSTELAKIRAKKMEDNGADLLMLLPPFILPATKENLKEYFVSVAQEVDIPIIIQYSPIETGQDLGIELLSKIIESEDNLKYLKVESKPVGNVITKILDTVEPKPGIFVGYAGLQMIDALKRGATGVMPGSSMTDVYSKIFNTYQTDIKKSIEIHSSLVAFLNIIFQSIEMIIKWEKVILARRNIITTDYCRHPNYKPDDTAKEIFSLYYERIQKEFII